MTPKATLPKTKTSSSLALFCSLEFYYNLFFLLDIFLQFIFVSRYTGARLSDYLSLHLTVIIEGATLRQIIMQKCNREFKLREKMLNDDPEHLRGFILFLAELFQQLEIQVKCCFLQHHPEAMTIPT